MSEFKEKFLRSLERSNEDILYSVFKQSRFSFEFDFLTIEIPSKLKVLEDLIHSKADMWKSFILEILSLESMVCKIHFVDQEINKHISDLNKGVSEALFLVYNFSKKDNDLAGNVEKYLAQNNARMSSDFLLGFFSALSELTGSYMSVYISRSNGNFSNEFNGMDSEIWFNLFNHIKNEFKRVLDSRVSPYIFPDRYCMYFKFDTLKIEYMREFAKKHKEKESFY